MTSWRVGARGARRKAVGVALAGFVLLAPRPGSAQQVPADLVAWIEEARRAWEVPGLAVTLVKDDAVVLARGFGVREAGKAAPVDEHTVFALSSMGKAFAAAAVGTLVDDGTVAWDDPVQEHLPWFRLAEPWPSARVTLRDLLAHRSGIAGDATWVATAASRETVVRRARHQVPVSEFRTRYDYSNVGITAAGEAAAAAAGTDWHTLIVERVLRPLGMRDASTSLETLWTPEDLAPCYQCALGRAVGVEAAKHPNLAMPHVREDGVTRPIAWRSVDNIAPAGSINASAVDMGPWLRMLLNEGTLDGRRVLSAEAVAEILAPQNVIRPDQLPTGAMLPPGDDGFHFWAYGLGWRMNDYRGRKMVWHTGGITGWYSIMALLPEEEVGVAVLTNAWRAAPFMLVYAIVLRAFDAYLGGEPRDWSAELLARSDSVAAVQAAAQRLADAPPAGGAPPSLPLAAYAGTYRNPAHDDLAVRVEAGRLIVGFPGALTGELEPWRGDTFRVRWRAPYRDLGFATFARDAEGRPARVELTRYGAFARGAPAR